MKNDDKHWIREKLQEAFLTAVRSCLNDEKAAAKAAASCLQFSAEQHACLARLSGTLGLPYSRQQLEHKIDYLRK
ncbi:MAG: hypothetical protein DME50_17530 [Verrucomicrobia bacterium]|nr:MAG: hypothetical protein DME85_10880 [Verrucomicrobiota bacterium]PYK63442.1 MAG: hypothetical protein DME50_17530 [Verrucomicrobiota bacterium]